jgi:hypothetical protein
VGVEAILEGGAGAMLREYRERAESGAKQQATHEQPEVRHEDWPPGEIPREPSAEDEALRAHRARILGALTTFGELKREEANDEAEHLLREGQRLQAMKRYRELTGVGLQEARDAIDGIAVWLLTAQSLPDENAPLPARRSWVWFVVAAVACVCIVLLLWRR